MAQRSFPCTSCGANIEVPDDYFKAQIACPACHARHHRLTGKAAALMGQAHAARAPQAQAPVAYPPQGPMPGAMPPGYPPQGPMPHRGPLPRPGAVPYPGAYPQMFAPMGPPPKSSNKGLWIGLGIAGGVLMLMFVAVIVAIPLIAGASVDLDDSSGWYEHTSEAGRYSVKFPGKPMEESKTLSNGVRSTEAVAIKGGHAYIVTYFDLPTVHGVESTWSAAKGFASVADVKKASVSSLQPVTFCGRDCTKAILENAQGYRAELISMRVRDRVYVLGCERLRGSAEINTRPFLDTFRLLTDPKVEQTLALYKKVGRSWTHRLKTRMSGVDTFGTQTKVEVVSVGDDSCEIRTTLLDRDGKPLAGAPPLTSKMEFRMLEGGATGSNARMALTKQETIRVEAGEFECLHYTATDVRDGTQQWVSKKYPGLIVKAVTRNQEEFTMELVEFIE